VHSLEGILNAVRTGIAVALVPASAARGPWADGVAFRPVMDLAPSTVAVAYRPDTDDPRVRAFAAIAKRAVSAADGG
jgi:DNA-binding transcriptional LysR family regulator